MHVAVEASDRHQAGGVQVHCGRGQMWGLGWHPLLAQPLRPGLAPSVVPGSWGENLQGVHSDCAIHCFVVLVLFF